MMNFINDRIGMTLLAISKEPWSKRLSQMAHDQEVVGWNFGAGKVDGCYVDCFTQHNPPATLE